jgi:predicted ATP-grasp superfamily ATP-dependent carboligase
MDDLLQGELRLDPDARYFLYVGEIKSLCLCPLVGETLTRKEGVPTRCVAIIPDVVEGPLGDNVLVLNPESRRLARSAGRRVCRRGPTRDFAAMVSSSAAVGRVVDALLAHQDAAWLYTFESVPELTLVGDSRVRHLGPDPGIARQWNDKTYHFRRLDGHVPLPEHVSCLGREGLQEALAERWDVWRDGAFVTRPFGAAGANSFFAHGPEDVEAQAEDDFGPWRASRYLPHAWDPTVLAVVANPDDVVILGLADQRIEGGTAFRGSCAPTLLADDVAAELRRLTRTVGALMARDGYRGIFGCDYVVGDEGEILLVEVNARKQGTTMEMACARELALPDAPSLTDLEYAAVVEGRFGHPVADLETERAVLHWGTYNFKVDRDVETHAFLPQREDERLMFRGYAADPGGGPRHVIVEHVGAGALVKSGTFLGRAAALGSSRAEVESELERAREALGGSFTVREHTHAR